MQWTETTKGESYRLSPLETPSVRCPQQAAGYWGIIPFLQGGKGEGQ